MKKLTSLVSILLVICLTIVCLPFSVAKADSPVIQYGNSFLLALESESQKEFTKEDFPLVENISCVYIIKAIPLENGYEYLLVIGLTTDDETLLEQAKVSGKAYGEVCENVLAYDYADCHSSMTLNHTQVDLKVGETFDLKMVERYLFPEDEVLSGILFTIDPKIIDPAALVESGYKELGFRSIYGAMYEEPKAWRGNTALLGYCLYDSKNKVSENHQYVGELSHSRDPFVDIDALMKHPGVVQAQLLYEHGAWPTVVPTVEFTSEPQGVLAVEYQRENDDWWGYGTFTALQPGEVIITASYGGIATGTATATCKVVVKEPATVTSTDIEYGDVNEDERVDAKDALLVLRYCVGKHEFTPKQQEVADFSYRLYRTENHKGIDVKDALAILQCSASAGPFRPVLWEKTVTYTDYDNETRYDYSWEVSAIDSYPDTLCRSLEDLAGYLSENNLPEEWANSYTEEYFETNSLLLFTGFEPCAGDLWTVEEIQKSNTGLNVKVVHHSLSMIDVAAMHLYHLEIHDPLKEIEWGYVRRTAHYGTWIANILVNS